MKPFNLKKALAGHPLVTRDGQAVKSIIKNGLPVPLSATLTSGDTYFYKDDGTCPGLHGELEGLTLLLAKPRPKSETRKNVERVRAIMGREWLTLETIERELQRRFNVYLPEQSISARVRDLRKQEYGSYDVRKKQVGKGLFAYKNFGKKGAVKA